MDSIILFKGSKRDFNKLLKARAVEDFTPFMELIRQYNITVRANDINASQYAPDGFGENRLKMLLFLLMIMLL